MPQIHTLLLRFFRRVVRSYFRRHFRSVMVQGGEAVLGHKGPLIIYGNHSSWWDPMICILLAAELMPGARHFAPIDARALAKYPILAKLGLFPVELASARGAVSFLRTSEAILAAGGVLWITPQGEFTDPRRKPLHFRAGLASLIKRVPAVALVPLATEYTFWDERLPEALGRFGEKTRILPGSSVGETTTQLEQALAEEMTMLERASSHRDANAFQMLLSGARGSGGSYGLIRRLRAWITGRQFDPDHTQR